jgi:hypothetical protein
MTDYQIWLDNQKNIEYEFVGLGKRELFELGMIFMSEKPLVLKNRDFVESQRTLSKSFQNVLLELDARYRKAL